ncbi:MAG: 4Fe-4S dicluster domain-containing protein [Rhodanobacteraceae bacterium]
MIDRVSTSSTDAQQPCVHCGACVRACPEGLDPERLFFALVADDFAAARADRIDACSECNRCVDVCPSHIPLLDWLRWGKEELFNRARADAARDRFVAREARLAREREACVALRRGSAAAPTPAARTISHDEVLAAIARGSARKARAKQAPAFEAAVVRNHARDGRSGALNPEVAPLAEWPDGAAIRDDRTR